MAFAQRRGCDVEATAIRRELVRPPVVFARMQENSESLSELAERCRAMAKGASTPETRRMLEEIATDYERKVARDGEQAR